MNKLVVQTQRYKMYLAHKRFINKRSISRICKRLQQKYKTGVVIQNFTKAANVEDDVTKIEE